ncbi:acyclic terpene utilization AtuA family protein [Nocardioides caldifontis]|uniref:acyclic terpene utilization AtuA family protein n=1 Tax=Nocardioides caldifontis TaxID=2588938 RepID=UPI0011DFE9D6|nr:acyclic terpene utilization AtuA family protein [Nocardioides caldifontis]
MSDVLRIGNCSGFYGDRVSAMREMLEGGELDVLTGDYLAELTMLILGRDRMKDEALGYARTFVRQVEDCLALALEKGVRIVTNAGGVNPAGLAERIRKIAAEQGLECKVAYVDGDNLLDRAEELGFTEDGAPLTANAYLGAFGIAAALDRGADVVVTGRVTDASVVVGPAISAFGWGRTTYDELAGAVVAGHVIECGTQATGGNFSGFRALARAGHLDRPLGFPIAEMAADGSCVITKHAGTGGLVTVDTVTAQLLYEIQSTVYLNPDVTTHLDTVRLTPDGDDRVRISGVRGSAPPPTTKVCLNHLGGFRNQMELILTGLDIEAKADWVRTQVEQGWGDARAAEVDWTLARTDHQDAGSEEAASARLRVVIRDPSSERAGKAFTAPLVEQVLASYPGLAMTTPPTPGGPYGVYTPAYVPQETVPHRVHHHDGTTQEIEPPTETVEPPLVASEKAVEPPLVASEKAVEPPLVASEKAVEPPLVAGEATRRVALGTIVHARSGDKGGDANVGLWVSALDEKAEQRAAWLLSTVTPDWVRDLLPEAQGLDVEVYPLPNLGGVNVLIKGLLGKGVAASSRFDPQAKGLGEWARSRHVPIPEELL